MTVKRSEQGQTNSLKKPDIEWNSFIGIFPKQMHKLVPQSFKMYRNNIAKVAETGVIFHLYLMK